MTQDAGHKVDNAVGPPPGMAFAFRMILTLGAPIDQGTYDDKRHRIVPVLGGTIEGPGFTGLVLPGGADWQAVSVNDGLAGIYARSTLQHQDGTIVSMVNTGLRRGPQAVMARLVAGERVDPAEYYFRTAPSFDVQPGPHRWLAENLFVCVGARWPEAVHLDIFRVL